MKICIIAEGSYPYITGGVSSWIQMLVSWMPEHQFIIYTVGAYEKEKGKFNYELPENVIEVKEVFLDAYLREKGKWGRRLNVNKHVKEDFMQLLTSQLVDWSHLFSFIGSLSCKTVTDFLTSKDYFDILKEIYIKKFSTIPFTEFFYAIRSMLLPLLYIIKQGIPKADLYHSVSTGYAGIMGSLGKYLYKKPFILTEHGIYTREREEEIIKSDWIKGDFKDIWIQHFYCLSKCAYVNANKVITLFGRNKEIEIELGCNENKIEIIPNGIDVGKYRNIPHKDASDEYINIGAIVRIVPIKDIKTMIQGFAIAKDMYHKLRLYIMGPLDEDMNYYEECKQLVESLELKDVIFTGKVNIVEYIGKMDMLILSSISEGQPLAILEGMASGKPFITTDVGSCRELLYGERDEFGEAGVVVPVMDYERIGHTIVALCKNKELMNKMGRAALKRVSELYSKEKMVIAYKNTYESFGGGHAWLVSGLN
jgi:glycosyltransferase involved in cell wall biosynthesis